MGKTIAICGFAKKNLHYVKESRADEFWTMNHHVFLGVPDLPRVDCLFEMHKRDWFCRKEIASSQGYWEWLKEPHPFPILMQHKFKAIPASVKFPLDEVVKDLFSGLTREQATVTYLTSSVAYMLAYAIHTQASAIELYGVDMATDTEYAYQKPGGEFMVGMALGRGIKVQLAPESLVCNALVYGYEGVPFISRQRLQDIHARYTKEHQKHHAEASALLNRPVQGNEQKILREMDLTHAYEGAWKICEFFLGKSDYYISRQQLEIHLPDYVKATESHKATANLLKGQYDYLREQKASQKTVRQKWDEYLSVRGHMYANMGVVQVIKNLMRECDLVPVSHDLLLTIQDI